MEPVYIVDAVRTPIGEYGGALAQVRPDDLLAHALRSVPERVGLEPSEADELAAGCANQAGEDNRDVARMSALLAGYPITVPGVTLTVSVRRGSLLSSTRHARSPWEMQRSWLPAELSR